MPYLAHASEHHAEAAEEVVRPDSGCTAAASAAPAHQVHGKRRQADQEADQCSVEESQTPSCLPTWSVPLGSRRGTHKGVGLAKVLRSSPLTWFWGER